jgi:hypothetical protein
MWEASQIKAAPSKRTAGGWRDNFSTFFNNLESIIPGWINKPPITFDK